MATPTKSKQLIPLGLFDLNRLATSTAVEVTVPQGTYLGETYNRVTEAYEKQFLDKHVNVIVSLDAAKVNGVILRAVRAVAGRSTAGPVTAKVGR